MKTTKLIRYFKLLNPSNLAKEVHIYGYDFSLGTHVLMVLLSLMGIGSIGILFKLKPVYLTVVFAAVCAILPIFILYMYKRMFEQQRFTDTVAYLEQMLYSFQKSGKVVSALKETRETFSDGRMRWTIDDAVRRIEQGNASAEKNILQEALEGITNAYECEKIQMVHQLLISSEEYGGAVNDAIIIVLEDIEKWKRRKFLLQAEKKTSNRDNIISIITATLICAAVLYILDSFKTSFPNVETMDIFTVWIIQGSSFIFVLAMLGILVKTMKCLTENWLQDEGIRSDEFVLESYETVMNFADASGRKKSIIYATPFFIGALVAVYFGHVVAGVILLCISAVMLTQHKIGYRLAKKDVEDSLYAILPQWLMELALLLQNNNVHVAIRKSMAGKPAVLQKELLLLLERLQERPGDIKSYVRFFEKFDIPEMQSCMKILHALSESGTGNAEIQINNLVQRVYEMQSIADDIQSQNVSFRMKLIFMYPVLAATGKLLVDLSVGMLYMLQMLSNIGGV